MADKAAMDLGVIPRKRLYREIADRLEGLIDDRTFRAGERLPAERDLARRLGVSRPSVREALIALEIAGRVEIRVGSGVYVTDAARSRASAPPEALGTFDVLAARKVVESEAAALAARHATAEDIRRIEQAFRELVAEANAEPVSTIADGRFHLRIAESCGNPAYACLVRTLWDMRQTPVAQRLDALLLTRSRRRTNIAEHRAILDAIRRRDPAAARRAMLRHIGGIARHRLSQPRAEPAAAPLRAERPRSGTRG